MANADDFVKQLIGRGETPEDQQRAIDMSRPPPPNVHMGSRPPANTDALKAAGKYALDFNRVLLDEAAMGTMRPINTMAFGTLYAARDLIGGEAADKGVLSTIGDAYGEAYNEIDTLLDDSVNNLGFGGTLLASLLGNASPFGAARAIDNAADAALDLGTAIKKLTFGQKLGRMGRAGLYAGATGALQSYFQGNTSMEDLVQSGAFSAGMGGLMQRLVGDAALPTIMNMRNAEGQLMSRIADTGPGVARNLNLRSIAEAVDSGQFNARGWLTAEIGDSPNYRQWEKLNDAMAEYAFKGVPAGKIDDQAIAMAEDTFARAHNAVSGAIDTVNREARDTFRTALDNPAGRKEALYENNELLRSAREAYRLMTETNRPNSIGRRPFSPQEILDRADKAILESLGRTDGSIADISPAMYKMRNRFKDLIRGREVQEVARDVQNIPSQGVNNKRAPEIIPPSLPLFRLIDARSALSEELTPSAAFQNGLTRSEVKAGKTILNELDDYLDQATNKGFGLARGAFAKGMKVEEAFDLGKLIYDQRMVEVKDQQSFAKYYGDYVTDMVDDIEDPDVLAAFRDGFKQAMFDQSGRRGFLEEMQYFVGPPDTAGETFFKGKGENYNLMVKILGQDDTNTIMELYRNGGHQERVMSLFRDNLIAAGADESTAFKLSNTLKGADAYLIDPAEPSLLIRSAKAVMNRMVKPSDKKMGDAALALLMSEGEDLERLISRGVKSAVGGVPISIGARMGGTADVGMFTETSSEEADRTRAEAEEAARTEQLKQYLEQLGIKQD